MVMHAKFPANMMVVGVVSNKGDITTPHYSAPELRINTVDYKELLVRIVRP